jgi:hypothetical protein
MKNSVLFIGLALAMSALAAPEKIKISSYVDADLGGDIGQYEETMSLSRNQTRKMYMDEVVNAALKLSQGLFNPGPMIEPLMKVQENADKKRDINKEIDSIGIGFSMGEFLRSEIEKIYKRNGLQRSERKIEFVNPFPNINGRPAYNPNAIFDHYIYLHIAHLGRGVFRISGTLGSIADSTSGIERSFSGDGKLVDALAQVAEEIFRAAHEDERPAWKNPNPQLTWIPGPADLRGLDEQEAKAYCINQGARLPLAEELIMAHHGTNYRSGGINRFKLGEAYHVDDQRRQLGGTFVVTFQNYNDGRAVIQPTIGTLGKVWCVKGEMSDRNKLIKKLFSIRRKHDPKGNNVVFFSQRIKPAKLPLIFAVESLLTAFGVMDAGVGNSISLEDYMSPSEAVEILENSGEKLGIPSSVIDFL